MTPGGGEDKRRGSKDRISMLLSCANSPYTPNTDAHGHTGAPLVGGSTPESTV